MVEKQKWWQTWYGKVLFAAFGIAVVIGILFATGVIGGAGWHKIASYEGNPNYDAFIGDYYERITTDEFTVKGEKWHIKWNADPVVVGFLQLTIRDSSGIVDVARTSNLTSRDFGTYEPDIGAGTYTVDIVANGLAHWEITIEDYC